MYYIHFRKAGMKATRSVEMYIRKSPTITFMELYRSKYVTGPVHIDREEKTPLLIVEKGKS